MFHIEEVRGRGEYTSTHHNNAAGLWMLVVIVICFYTWYATHTLTNFIISLAVNLIISPLLQSEGAGLHIL